MLKLLRKLFAKKPEEEQITIPFEKLDEWINQKSMDCYANQKQELQQIIEIINDEIRKTNENLETLRAATLPNPNITEREKQFLIGNKEAYLKRIGSFIRDLPIPKKIEDITPSHEAFMSALAAMSKATARSYRILQEFLANESRTVAINIKNIESKYKECLKLVENEENKHLAEIKDLSNSIKNKERKANDLKESLSALQKKIDAAGQKRKELESTFHKLQQSNDFERAKDLLQKRTQIEKQLSEHKNILTQSFSVLDRALKKYSRVSLEHDKAIEKYLDDPIKAIKGDTHLTISDILKGLEKNIQSKEINLKDKKEEKTLQEIKKLDEKFLSDYAKTLNKLEQREKEITSQIQTNKLLLEEKELKQKINAEEKRIRETQDKIPGIEEEIKKITTEDRYEKLKEALKTKFNVTLS